MKGYPGCRPYAAAIANGEADINLCPPGGEEGIRKLADLLGLLIALKNWLNLRAGRKARGVNASVAPIEGGSTAH